MINHSFAADRDAVRAFFGQIYVPGTCVEIRAWRVFQDRSGYLVPATKSRHTFAGYFDDADAFVNAASAFRGVSAYVTVNPIKADLLSRCGNRLSQQDHCASADDVAEIRAVLIDLDPKRPPDISSTDAELDLALAVARRIFETYPEIASASVWGTSGNGVWIRLGIANADAEASRELIALLREEFNTDRVKIDDKTWNPGRVMALPGTWKCKGENTPSRPWRLAVQLSPSTGDRLDLAEFLSRQGRSAAVVPDVASSKPARKAGDRSRSRERAYAMACLEQECRIVAGAREGDRNNALNESAFTIGTLLGWGAISREEAESELRAAAKSVGLEDREIDATLRSGLDSGMARPRDLSEIANQPKPAKAGNPSKDEKPTIFVTTDQVDVNNQAIEALASDDDLYSRSGLLVRIVSDKPKARSLAKLFAPGAPRIEPVTLPTLREKLSQAANWKAFKDTKEGLVELPCHPPRWCPDAILDRGSWPALRDLSAIIEIPTIRPDGSLLTKPGWDSETGLVHLPSLPPFDLPARPTKADARAAAERLFAIVDDFPFEAATHKSAWLAQGLTLVGRFAIAGPCPQFMVTSNASGTGKTKLASIWPIASTGRRVKPTPFSNDPEELRKLVLAIGMRGSLYVLFDNEQTGGAVGNKFLDAILTATGWEDRLLGVSRVVEFVLYSVWIVTGNNLSIAGDLHRRTVSISLQTDLERPELRSEFAIPDIEEYVHANRSSMIRDALTILRAHAIAGWPESGSPILGSYPDWERKVRGPLLWLGFEDPCLGVRALREENPQSVLNSSLVHGWGEIPSARSEGLTTSEAINYLNNYPNAAPMLRQAFAQIAKDGKFPTPSAIGYKLRAIKGTIYDGARLVPDGKRHQAQVWKFEQVNPSVKGEDGRIGEDGSLPSEFSESICTVVNRNITIEENILPDPPILPWDSPIPQGTALGPDGWPVSNCEVGHER